MQGVAAVIPGLARPALSPVTILTRRWLLSQFWPAHERASQLPLGQRERERLCDQREAVSGLCAIRLPRNAHDTLSPTRAATRDPQLVAEG